MTNAPHSITVVIDSESAQAAGLDPDWLTRILKFALHEEHAPAASLTLLVTSDAGIQELHRDYMGDETPTDVLAFGAESEEEFPMEPGAGRYLGDIAVSWDMAAAQGPESGLTPKGEAAFLALHGLLHLLGMNDATEAERASMHARQHALLAAFLLRGSA